MFAPAPAKFAVPGAGGRHGREGRKGKEATARREKEREKVPGDESGSGGRCGEKRGTEYPLPQRRGERREEITVDPTREEPGTEWDRGLFL